MVGRAAELARLDAALEGLLVDRAPRALTLIADAGLGKSRLLHAFAQHLSAHRATWWLMPARAQPSSGLQPYGLLRDLLARRLEIADSDSADVARDKLVQGLALDSFLGKVEAQLGCDAVAVRDEECLLTALALDGFAKSVHFFRDLTPAEHPRTGIPRVWKLDADDSEHVGIHHHDADDCAERERGDGEATCATHAAESCASSCGMIG